MQMSVLPWAEGSDGKANEVPVLAAIKECVEVTYNLGRLLNLHLGTPDEFFCAFVVRVV